MPRLYAEYQGKRVELVPIKEATDNNLKFPQLLPTKDALAGAKSAEKTDRVAREMGHCQCCNSFQKLPRGHLSLHGYTVAQGYFQGVCAGAGQLPYELSCDFIKTHIIPGLQDQIKWTTTLASRFPQYPYVYTFGEYGLNPVTIEQNDAGLYSLQDSTGEWLTNDRDYRTRKDVFNPKAGSHSGEYLYKQLKQNFDYRMTRDLNLLTSALKNREEAVANWTLQPVKSVMELAQAKTQASLDKPLTSSEKAVVSLVLLQGKKLSSNDRYYGNAIQGLIKRGILSRDGLTLDTSKLRPEDVTPHWENKTAPKVWQMLLDGAFDPFKVYKPYQSWDQDANGKSIVYPYGHEKWKADYSNTIADNIDKMVRQGYLVGDIHNPAINPNLLPILKK